MRTFLTLFRREMQAFLVSPIAYVLGCLFLLLMGAMFGFIVKVIGEQPQQRTILYYFYTMYWLPGLFIPALITMRLFSEEKKTGTLEMLMTAPVSDWQVVLSKFAAALGLYTLMWLPTIGYVFILREIVTRPEMLEVQTSFSGCLFVILNAALLMAVGLWASSMTRNQIISAVVAFVMSFVFLIIPDWMFSLLRGHPAAEIFRYISPNEHASEYALGNIQVQPVIYYLSFTFFFLLFTVRIIESRKWK